jgi:hypothetical protein
VDPLAPSGEAFDSVLDKGFPFLEVPGDVPVPGAGDKLMEDGLIVDSFFHVVVDGKAHGREGLAAGLATESLDRSGDLGLIETDGMIPLFRWRGMKTGAFWIGAMGRDHL